MEVSQVCLRNGLLLFDVGALGPALGWSIRLGKFFLEMSKFTKSQCRLWRYRKFVCQTLHFFCFSRVVVTPHNLKHFVEVPQVYPLVSAKRCTCFFIWAHDVYTWYLYDAHIYILPIWFPYVIPKMMPLYDAYTMPLHEKRWKKWKRIRKERRSWALLGAVFKSVTDTS